MRVDLGGGRGWLEEAAAASIARVDRQIGHRQQVTEAGRTWEQQKKHWDIYQRDGKPIALHPDTPSIHQLGAAIDTNERHTAILNDHGWFHTVYRNGQLVEPWHYEYFANRDNHRGGSPAGGNATPIQKEWDEMATRQDIKEVVAEVVRDSKLQQMFLISYSSPSARNGIVLAGPGYWHPLTGEQFEHFSWLKSAQGRTLFAGLEVFTPINDRSWDILRDICVNDGDPAVEGVDYGRIEQLVKKGELSPAQPVIDYAQLAKAMKDAGVTNANSVDIAKAVRAEFASSPLK